MLRHLDNDLEHASRIVPHVDDQTFHSLLLQVSQLLLKAFRGIHRELGNFDDADLTLFHPGIYRFQCDIITNNRIFQSIRGSCPFHLDFGFGPFRAADFGHRLIQAESLKGLPVHRQ
ncbi:hypothetical protein D3C73_1325110 [compost metagenome]